MNLDDTPLAECCLFFCWHRGYSRPRQKTWTYCDYWPYCPQRVLLQNLARVQYLQSGAHRYLVFGEEDEQQRKRRGCVAGSLQYPHAGEQKEEGTSERKECADRIKDKLHVPCCSHNLCPGFSFECEYTVISFYVWYRSSLGSKILNHVCNLNPQNQWALLLQHFILVGQTKQVFLCLLGADLFDSFTTEKTF